MSGNSADRKRFRKLTSSVVTALERAGYLPRTNTTPAPWYESNLLWGSLSICSGILCTVLGRSQESLTALLPIAWAFFGLFGWAITRPLQARKTRYAALTLIVVVSGAYLGSRNWSVPPANVSRAPTSASARVGPLMGKTEDGRVYTIPVDPHHQMPAFSDNEKIESDRAALQFITQKRWTVDQVTPIRSSNASFDGHGLAFDESRTFIDDRYVDDIARYQGYVCPTNTPEPGDVVIYRRSGRVTNSGLVVGQREGTVRVRTKWGMWPEFEHDIDKVPEQFGAPQFWRKCSS